MPPVTIEPVLPVQPGPPRGVIDVSKRFKWIGWIPVIGIVGIVGAFAALSLFRRSGGEVSGYREDRDAMKAVSMQSHQTKLWKLNTTTGLWNMLTIVPSDEANEWLKIYRRDVPGTYKISRTKPRSR